MRDENMCSFVLLLALCMLCAAAFSASASDKTREKLPINFASLRSTPKIQVNPASWSGYMPVLEYDDLRHINGSAVTVENISVVEGRDVKLPCDVTAPIDDYLRMVFWFKNNDSLPIYTINARDTPFAEAKHMPSALKSRAHFHMLSPKEAFLLLSDVKRLDAAIYRCRVDYHRKQSKSVVYNLTVIVPPEKVIILVHGLSTDNPKPHKEGDDLYLTCQVTGGNPEPVVQWFVDGRISVNNDFSQSKAGEVIEKRLAVRNLNRSHLKSNFSCHAQNSLLARPKVASFVLDMNLKPLTVEIRRLNERESLDDPLEAGRTYKVECETTGSRPPAVITWYKGRGTKFLKHVKDEKSENRTISWLDFDPGVDDNGRKVTCRAENPNGNGLFLEKSWKINVVYSPIVSLKLGSTLSADDIKEGDDVYFECHIKSNPPWTKLSWIHNDEVLSHNTSARIIWSNQSLVLQSVTRSSAGIYVCAAANALAETKSEALHFRVKYAPVCKEEQIVIVGASRGESLEITCKVEADPPAHSFRWKFNNSGETLEVPAKRYSVRLKDGISVLKYTPTTELDYGTLSCWADNAVGTQSKPCLFQLVAAGKPFPVRNCTLSNQTYTSVEVKCVPGYDGGLPQKFILEVYHGDADIIVDKRLMYNISSMDEPIFALSDLEAPVNSGVHVVIYAINAKGKSNPVVLSEVTFRDAEKHTGQETNVVLSPLIGIIVGALITLILIVLIIIIRARKDRVAKLQHSKRLELSELPRETSLK